MVKKITVNLALSPKTVEQADKLAAKMGLSRSAFFEFFANQTFPYVPMIEEMLSGISDSVSKEAEKGAKSTKKGKSEVDSKV